MNQINENIRALQVTIATINYELDHKKSIEDSLKGEDKRKISSEINRLVLKNQENKIELKKMLYRDGVEV